MNFNENTVNFSNEFIEKPNVDKVSSPHDELEFKKYFQHKAKEKENQIQQKQLQTPQASIPLAPPPPPHTQSKGHSQHQTITVNEIDDEIIEKEIIYNINVDSRDRDKNVYKNANFFKTIFGQRYANVKSVKLTSIEFPNTSSVINTSNNKIYWRNSEDILKDTLDTVTKEYPVYSIDLTPGSYTLTQLELSITDKMNLVKRENLTGDFHFFQVTLNELTDLSKFISLTLQKLNNNPIEFTVNLNTLTINATAHGFEDGDIVYITGALSSNGITSSVLNTSHTVIGIGNPDKFKIEIKLKPNATAVGGGNTVSIGREAPFQFLYGSETNTIANNLGFPIEDSSQRINFYFQQIKNFKQIKIDLVNPHKLSRNFPLIGSTCQITGSTTSPSIDGFSIITDISDDYSILINKGTFIDFQVYPSGAIITIDSIDYEIHTITNYDATIKLDFYNDHNYTFSDILSKSLNISTTNTVPDLKGTRLINSIPESNSIVIKGSLFDEFPFPGTSVLGSVLIPENGGNCPVLNPLTTKVLIIEDITVGNPTIIKCTNHEMKQGDDVRIKGIRTVPLIISDTNTGIYTITNIIDADHFSINFNSMSYNNDDVQAGLGKVCTRIVNCFFPFKGFTKIYSITYVGANIYGTHTVDIVVDDATFVFLQNATSFIISNTDTIPSLNHDILTNALTVNASYPLLNKVNVTIPSALIQNGTTGVIGLNNDFIMYGAESVGSISTNILNSVKYKVRDIIDSSNFTFLANDYAETAETGGGDNVSISSIAHGFNGIQTNEKNGKVFRSINLQGENYVFLCCNKLKGYEDTNNVKNILEKIILDQSPNHVCFKPIEKLITFEQGILPYLQDFEFEVRNWDGSLYDFKDLDYSFTLEITTVQKALKNMNNNRNELTTYKI